MGSKILMAPSVQSNGHLKPCLFAIYWARSKGFSFVIHPVSTEFI